MKKSTKHHSQKVISMNRQVADFLERHFSNPILVFCVFFSFYPWYIDQLVLTLTTLTATCYLVPTQVPGNSTPTRLGHRKEITYCFVFYVIYLLVLQTSHQRSIIEVLVQATLPTSIRAYKILNYQLIFLQKAVLLYSNKKLNISSHPIGLETVGKQSSHKCSMFERVLVLNTG